MGADELPDNAPPASVPRVTATGALDTFNRASTTGSPTIGLGPNRINRPAVANSTFPVMRINGSQTSGQAQSNRAGFEIWNRSGRHLASLRASTPESP